jgi:DNA-binding MarR family transcriptional regulator
MLTRRVYFHMVRGAGRLLQPLEVTVEQYIVLALLAEEAGLTQQELVKRCASDPRTMGKMLDALGAKGWTKRVHHRTDRRAWQIVLSAKGRRVEQQMERALIPLRAQPARILGAAKLQAFKKMLALLGEELDPAKWLFSEASPRKSPRPTKPSKPTPP